LWHQFGDLLDETAGFGCEKAFPTWFHKSESENVKKTIQSMTLENFGSFGCLFIFCCLKQRRLTTGSPAAGGGGAAETAPAFFPVSLFAGYSGKNDTFAQFLTSPPGIIKPV
jgi:hypothetical protein